MTALVQRIIAAIGSGRLVFETEAELHKRLAKRFDHAGIAFTREHRLNDKDRLDFWLPDGIAIEVKVKESDANILRQVKHYCDAPEVNGVIVICIRPIAPCPATLSGKPVATIPIWKNLL